jgi:tRNA threonylcarbamoyladenosine biosynthesis protein TsaE
MKKVNSTEAMKDLGSSIGALLRGGECIELVGDVGAGKTTFVKGLAVGLAIDDDVQSPSFTISRTYEARDDLQLVHYDFYRLNDAGIMADELREVAGHNNIVTVVEWSDIVKDVLPEDCLTLTFSAVSENERTIDIQAAGESSQAILEKMT